ncbi:hypothetical protein [Agrobacterium sp. Azo12]|uniref:hypothetical protein n=1 Tax=Agrobacterium sp. Azo12 TaxID=3031129 RepID=UPI0023D7F1B1|nr:hypothetical protein [Agrobacterium sp. Azo12]MDO5895665.1 hypothetical protein [Agrobacterium sp. Azo12]
MDQKKPGLFEGIQTFVWKCWCIFILPASPAIGAYIGLHTHGIGGAIGLGLVGVIVGVVLAIAPRATLELLG